MSGPVKLKSVAITGKAPGPKLLILGGIHGDEFESMWAIRRLKEAMDPGELCGTVTLVPVVNEAAYWRGQRTAEDGLDLARTCPGRADGTITERIAHAVSAMIREADYLIDLHSGGLISRFFPTVGYMLHADADVLARQREMARAFNMPVVWGTYAGHDGRTLSIARDAGIPAIYSEWMGAGDCDPAGVDGYYEGCLNVMGVLGMIERDQPPSIIRHTVEDDREGAGHIQLNYPAPFSGFFEPWVELMDRVEPGDGFGVVTDLLGDRREEIVSTQSGHVLVLRTFNRVHEGETIAAVLEV
ncbi:MAG: M14 family metallopeptidase [candidate division Zixibacteria bacterium]|nr:M14 family metallopeptidase [candidate division Zixibacteria bacterium]